MTNEEALKELKERVECADWVEKTYCDCVSVDAIRVAVDAIEKQIPKIPQKGTRRNGVKFYYCPHCKWVLLEVADGKYYCLKCGQRLDWGD